MITSNQERFLNSVISPFYSKEIIMKKIVVSLLFIPSVLFSQQQVDIPWPTLAKSDWPMIKHDPQFTGRSPYRGPQTPTIIWTADLEDGIFSGPVIGSDNNLYFGSYFQDPYFLGLSDYFYSYTADGKFRWQYKTGTSRPPQSGILIDSGNTIYFGSLDRYFYALNPDGTLKWKYYTTAPIPENVVPNIDLDGNIYFTNGLGGLYSLKPDGTFNWNIKYENGFNPRIPVFSPDGQTIYIAGRDSNLFALDPNDGSIKWKFRCGRMQKAPLVDNEGNLNFLAMGNPEYFYSLSSEGDERWKFLVQGIGPAGSYSAPTMDYEGNLYFIAFDSTFIGYYPMAMYSLNYEGKFRWKYIFENIGSYQEDIWQPLICDTMGTIYAGSTFGYYYYAISKDGQLKWKLPLEWNKKQVDNTGAISKDGTLYIGVHGSADYTGFTKTLIAIKDTGTVSVNEKTSEPSDYKLYQNYPNPFNPLTKINFNIRKTGNVKLEVFDIYGSRVAILVDGIKREGENSVIFDGSRLASGVYVYRLQAGDFTSTRKMTLLR